MDLSKINNISTGASLNNRGAGTSKKLTALDNVVLSKAELKNTKKPPAITPPPQVMILKRGGLDAILNAIKCAGKNINIQSFIFTDTRRGSIVQELKNAAKRGVHIKVMIEKDPFYWEKNEVNPSLNVIKELTKSICRGTKECKEIEFKWSNPLFTDSNFVSHEKSISIDKEKAFILTGNLSQSAFTSNLDIGAILFKNPALVGEIDKLYDSDWARLPYEAQQKNNLIISPNNSRENILDLIKNAKKSIHILQQSITDNEILKTLVEKQNEGLNVEVILANPTIVQTNIPSAAYLKNSGIKVSYLEKPYLHAKAVTVDTEDNSPDNNISFVGSQNFSSAAIGIKKQDKTVGNRELGIIFNDPECSVDKIFKETNPDSCVFPSQQIFTEPGIASSAIRKAASLADKAIICQTNIFTNKLLAGELCNAGDRGVDVKVMMPQNPFSDSDSAFTGNIETAKKLQEHKVQVKWTDTAFKNISGTVMVFDENQLILSPDNLTTSAFFKNKSFGIIATEPADVKYLKKRLEIDWNKINKLLLEAPPKVVTPEERKGEILNLIRGAQKKILLETKELSDYEIVNELKKKAAGGIEVKIMLEDNKFNEENDKKTIEKLIASGAKVELVSNSRVVNTFIEIDDNILLLSGGNLFYKDFQETNTYGIIADEKKNVEMTAQAYQINFLLASIDQVSSKAYMEKKEIIQPFDKPVLDLLFEKAKYGVKVDMRAYKYGTLNYLIKKINEELEKISMLDPRNDKDRKEIIKFYNMNYNPEAALESQKKLIEALSKLKPREKLVSLKKKNWHHIEEEYILADDKKVILPETKLYKSLSSGLFIDYSDYLEARMPSRD